MSAASSAQGPLAGLTVVEISAFVAAPLGAMTLAQLGATVIRVDPLGGNIDHSRWPITQDGTSLYWASLNKGKRSVTLDLKSEEGQRVATELIASAGAVITNLPARGWLSYDNLRQHREDLLMLRLTGTYEGGPAVDYTVNAASGFPTVTGFDTRQVNNALPAWDVAAGLYIATGFLGAELERRRSGAGQEITLALSDVMLATVGNLGYLADVQVNRSTRVPLGNAVYGAYGQSFATRDQREMIVVAISNRQWDALGKATGLSEKLASIGPLLDVDIRTEGGRFAAREAIDAVLRPWFARHTVAEIREVLANAGVLQGTFQSFEQLVDEDPSCSVRNPLFSEIDQPGVGQLLAPGNPLRFHGTPLAGPQAAPQLGKDSAAVLSDQLGYAPRAIDELRTSGVLAPQHAGITDAPTTR